MNDGKPTQRHWRPDFTGSIFIATSRCREITSARFFETFRRPKLWDPAKPTQGLPILNGHKISREKWRLIFIGKGLKEADHKTNWK
jgi:hypothetical protein